METGAVVAVFPCEPAGHASGLREAGRDGDLRAALCRTRSIERMWAR